MGTRATTSARDWIPVAVLFVTLVIVVALVRTADRPEPVAAPTGSSSPAPSPPASAPEPAPIAFFIGDGSTAGVGIDRGVARWTSVLSATHGWRELNLARAGTGYTASPPAVVCGFSQCEDFPAMAKRAVREHPDIVIVSGGQNDTITAHGDFTTEAAAVDATFRTLRRGLPDALIVAVGPKPTWGATTPLLAIESAVRAAAETNRVIFVSLTSPAILEPSHLLDDGIHISEEGHALIATRVTEAIECWQTRSCVVADVQG